MAKVPIVSKIIEHTGTLPVTINADGKTLLDYRVYGNTGGVGDKTVNYFDAEISVGNIDNTSGADDDTTNVRLRSGFLSTALFAGVYTINASGIDEVVIYKYDAEKNFIGVETSPSYWGALPRAVTLSSVMFVRFVFRHSDNRRCYVSDISNIMFTPGTTPPETFVPFGYKLPMIVSDGYQIYDDTLPAQISANGMNFKNYRIFGAIGGVGDRTVQLFDKNATDTDNGYVSGAYIKSDGELQNSSAWFVSEYIPVNAEDQYTVVYGSQSSSRAVCYYDINKNYISGANYSGLSTQETITTPSTCAYMRLSLVLTAEDIITITPGTTPPETFVPFGYEVDISTEKPIIYGFHINPNDPNSYTAVTYLEDAVGKTPAAMGSTAFSYGDWADTFFMPRPCMLKYDGTVDYYLNPNDYSQKADGTPSDYNNLAYGGNAMVEFPLIWYKFVQGAESGEGYFYCSNRKVDDSYKCFSNMDCDGNIIEHFYMPIYNGCTYDGKMRSISGLQLSPWSTTAYSSSSTYAVDSKVNYNGRMWKCTTAVEAAEAFDPTKWEQFAFNGNTTGTEEITQATANNTTAKVEWYTNVLCDRQLINALLVLLSKSLDTQGSFGWGIDSGGQTVKEAYVTGSLNDKGLFYGSTTNRNTAVKVFGMENWWALVTRRTAGLVGAANNTYLYKMTYDTSDGSTANGYNINGTGYLSIGNNPTSNIDYYIKKMQYGLWGCLPIEIGSYSAQYFRDYYQSGTGYALFGGDATGGKSSGAFNSYLRHATSVRYWSISSDLSCKPCRTGNLSKNLEAATVTPIYIGDTALQKDEYIDYQAGKVYRRTVNEFDKDNATLFDSYLRSNNLWTTSATTKSVRIPVEPSTQYTLKIMTEQETFRINESDDPDLKPTPDGVQTKRIIRETNRNSYTFTTSATTVVIICQFDLTIEAWVNGLMLVKGDTAPETYTPYLQPTDLPVPLPALPTCEGTTIVNYEGQPNVPSRFYGTYINSPILPIYIGSDPLEKVGDYANYIDYEKQKIIKKMKKYVLTGDEGWYTQGGTTVPSENIYFRLQIAPLNYLSTTTNICSHFNKEDIAVANSIVGYRFYHTSASNADTLNIRPQNVSTTTLSDFKTWLAEQYTAGTPVTIWVALTTPEETDPPVALPALPTCEGTTVLDYDGTPAPSEMYIKYRGWSSRKDCAVKKYHISKNLYDGAVEQGGWAAMPVPGGSAEKYDIDIRCRIDKIVPLDSTTKYRATVFPNTLKIACFYFDEQGKVIGDTSWSEDNSNEIPIGSYSVVCTIKNQEETAIVPSDIQGIMITEGTDIPTEFDPYGKWWEDCVPRVLEVRTDTFTTLPATINVDRKVLLNYRIYGNTGGVGDEVDITGLSEPLCGIDTYTDSLDLSTGILTRKIKKLVLTGQENWYNRSGDPPNVFFFELAGVQCVNNYGLCTHYSNQESGGFNTFEDKHLLVRLAIDGSKTYIALRDSTYFATMSDFKSYIAQFYANGNPITVWYAIAEPEVSTITIPSGLTGTIEGYLIQDGTPTPQTPIYPTANGVKQADDTYSIKYSYKLDIGVKSTQLFDKNATDTTNGYVSGKFLMSDNTTSTNSNWIITEYIEINQNENYTLDKLNGTNAAYCLYDSTKNYISGAKYNDESTITFNSGNAKYIRFSVVINPDISAYNLDVLTFTEGTTPPDKYQPYSSTTTPIYIGDEPLEKDEYVDYAEQKVYRRTVNRFDISAQTLIDATGTGTMRTGVYLGFLAVGQYTLTFDAPHNYSLFITRKNGNTYTFQDVKKSQLPFTFLVNSGDEIIIRLSNTQTFEQQQFTNICVTPGTTPPETYVPYYQPTDPPIPLPEISTFSNTNTVLDYDGTPAPSFVVATYKSWFKHS